MSTAPSQYASNQIEVATRDNSTLLSEFAADAMSKIAAATLIHLKFTEVNGELISGYAAWGAVETVVANASAGQIGATAAFEDFMASLTRKPNIDTNSPIDAWELIIAPVYAYGSPSYITLLPQGRATVTAGTYQQRLDALRDLGLRLAAQAGKPTLIALGTTVTSFFNQASAKRDFQNNRKSAVENGRIDMEAVRRLLCKKFYKMIGVAMDVFEDTPLLVDSVWDVNILRNPAQSVPTAPADIFWDPITRTLRTTALPEGASRLEFWREGPGGMPEMLVVGERDALSIQLPANITFDVGDLYQLWLQARNSRGSSPASAKITWTGV